MGTIQVKFTEAEEAEIEALYTSANRLSIIDIGRRFECSEGPIRRVLIARGVEIRGAGSRDSQSLESGISQDYREGYTNGWRAALSAMRPVKLSAAWQRAHGHWKRNLVEWQEPGHDEVPPPRMV